MPDGPRDPGEDPRAVGFHGWPLGGATGRSAVLLARRCYWPTLAAAALKTGR